jgi:nucleoside-diphosphate kinase
MARQVDGNVLAFQAEWFDHHAQLNRTYLLKYFEESHSIEMIDVKTKKMFLKKSPCPKDIEGEDFYEGATVKLHGRLLTIKACHDKTTQNVLAQVLFCTVHY